jgi:hypothetical protein
MKRFALGLLLCLSIVALCGASDCHVQQVATVPVGQIYVPVYSAVYNPQVQSSRDDVLLEILAELRAMRAELAALRNPVQAPTLVSAVPIIRQQCARCHSPAGADKDGGGFVLVDARGELSTTLSDRDRQRVYNRVRGNSMPPAPAKVKAEEREAILKAFEKPK